MNRNKWCIVSCVVYGMYSMAGAGMDEITPLYLATSTKYGMIKID